MVKLGKKIVSLALVLGLTFSMGMVSSAATYGDDDGTIYSPGTGSIDKNPGRPGEVISGSHYKSVTTGTVTTDGTVSSTTSEVKINRYDPSAYSVADAKIRTTAGLRQILGNHLPEGTTPELLYVTEVTPVRKVTKENPLAVAFNVPRVAAGDRIFVLHCYDEENWEVIVPNKVDTEYVSATFTSLSPVAFVKVPRLSDNGNSPDKSPKTGM